MSRILRAAGVAGALALALVTSAAAEPQISITGPTAGSSISRATTPTLSVAGVTVFDAPQQAAKTLYLRRALCASGNDDAHLSVTKGKSTDQNGCAFIAQPANEVMHTAGQEPLSTTYPSDELTFTLDASRPITAKVRMTQGFGQGITEVRLTGMSAAGESVLLGTDSETYTTTGAMDLNFSVQPAAELDKTDFTQIDLNILVRGVNVLHGSADHRNGASTISLPIWNGSFSRKVQFAVDSPSFSPSATKTATLSADGTTWTGSTLTPAVGNHTLYAQVIQGATIVKATSVPFTVTP